MEVLLTGNIAFLTQRFIETAFPGDHVLAAQLPDYGAPDPAVQTVALDDKTLLHEVAQTYVFDKVVYFSAYLEPHNPQTNEMEGLRRVLQCCYQQNVQMLYVAGPEAFYEQTTGKTIIAGSALELCRQYAQAGAIEIKVVKSPYLYTLSPAPRYLANLFEQMQEGVLHLDEQPNQAMESLCDEDLAVLLYRLYDHWTPDYEEWQIPDVFAHTMQDLAEQLKDLRPQLDVSYGCDRLQSLPAGDRQLRDRFFWFPRYDLLQDLPQIYENWKAARSPKAKWPRRLVQKLVSDSKWVIGLETVLLFALAEALTALDHGMIQFRTVDFRLLFVVIIATVHGMTPGMIAAALATAALMVSYGAEGVSWVSLFYEPANWLAFIAYFITGAACGYIKLRNNENIRFIQEENQLLRQRVTFIRSIYQDTLADKRMYRRQLLGRKDSFGKIYSITRELESLQPGVLFGKTVQVLENVLENRTVSIYSIDGNQAYARLEVSSAAVAAKAPRSLSMKDYQEVAIAIERQGIWVNRQLNPALPMYAAGVRQEGRLLVLIMVADAEAEQMNLYVQNLFRILCGLLETALLRAYEYQRMARGERYAADTCLLKPDAFCERLRVAWDMQEKKIASHVLLRLVTRDDSARQIHERIARRIRANDAAGFGPDGACYLLLNQAQEENIPLILERLGESGYSMQVVTPQEELALACLPKEAGA